MGARQLEPAFLSVYFSLSGAAFVTLLVFAALFATSPNNSCLLASLSVLDIAAFVIAMIVLAVWATTIGLSIKLCIEISAYTQRPAADTLPLLAAQQPPNRINVVVSRPQN